MFITTLSHNIIHLLSYLCDALLNGLLLNLIGHRSHDCDVTVCWDVCNMSINLTSCMPLVYISSGLEAPTVDHRSHPSDDGATTDELVPSRVWDYRNQYGPLTRYVKLWVAHARGMPGTFSPPPLQRKRLVNDPGMHHGTCVTHVPWCMTGSLTHGDGENVPGTPGACATRNFPYLVRGPCI